ncbi:MAG: hypothetical protein KJ070_12345 [Verrucomicrobia bacterium]|nr:hypothetical protein [Verrucomicrobiota bacterium]
MNREEQLRRRIKWVTWLFIIGLVLSGATAIPLNWEVGLLTSWFGLVGKTSAPATGELGRWLLAVREALQEVNAQHPLLFYGTDWLAFGHFVIAITFVGALRDPVRNVWLFTFGMIACLLVIPYALIFGAVRGIPIWWRLIDGSFGVFGLIPL